MNSNAQPLESAWQTLRSSLDGPQAFALVFVFCDDARAKQALFERANDWMQAQVRPFQRPKVPEAGALLAEVLPLAVNPASVHARTGMPLWLDLDGNPGDPQWNDARHTFLLRLNERRATLMREHPRAVVLALPLEWTKPAAEAAPDLWTIRQPSVYLETFRVKPAPETRLDTPQNPVIPTPLPGRESAAAGGQWPSAQSERHEPVSVWSAARAVDTALENGDLDLAWKTVSDTVAHARQSIVESGRTPAHVRDLSVSLNKLGDVAQALGRLDEARSAYAEGETLARELIGDFGRTPERLRDLSVSLNKLGDVAQALGRLDEAGRAYAEGETLARELIGDFGRTPERLRDLSVSLNKLGDVAQALGRLDEAGRAYAEGETLRRELIGDFGRTPERLRDLSVSLNKLGAVAQALGRLDEAGQWFSAEVETAEALIEQYGETAGALEVLAYGHKGLGHSLRADKQPDLARVHYEHARRLYQRLALALPLDRRYQAALAELDDYLTKEG